MIILGTCLIQIEFSILNIAYKVAPKPNNVEECYFYTFDVLWCLLLLIKNKQRDHIHVQFCTCIATQTNTIHLKTRFNSKSTLQQTRLRIVRYKITHRLAATTLSKFKIIQYSCSNFIHDIYSNNFTTKNRQRGHKYMIFA